MWQVQQEPKGKQLQSPVPAAIDQSPVGMVGEEATSSQASSASADRSEGMSDVATLSSRAAQPEQASSLQRPQRPLSPDRQGEREHAESYFRRMTPEELTVQQAEEQAEEPAVDRKRAREKYYNSQEAKAKNATGIYSNHDLRGIKKLWNSAWGKNRWKRTVEKGGSANQDVLMLQAQNKNFSDFQHLDVVLRNYLASEYIKKNRPFENESPKDYVERMTHNKTPKLLNPVFRLGVSLGLHGGLNFEETHIEAAFFREVDSLCNTEIMLKTITTQPDMEQINPPPKSELIRNQASQIFIAKTLLLAQMSDLKQKNDDNTEQPWGTTVANAFAHGSRVAFITPISQDDSAEEERKMWEQLTSLQNDSDSELKGNAANLYSRWSSTHNFQRRAVGKAFKETKVLANLFGQKGMDVAIGGYLNEGLNHSPIMNDGTCGHFYMMKKSGNKTTCGGALIGFESVSPGMTNQIGHIHGIGNESYSSCFGGLRTDEIGTHYGGRIADLNKCAYIDMKGALLLLENYMKSAFKFGKDTTQDLAPLVGRKMNREEISTYLARLYEGVIANEARI